MIHCEARLENVGDLNYIRDWDPEVVVVVVDIHGSFL